MNKEEIEKVNSVIDEREDLSRVIEDYFFKILRRTEQFRLKMFDTIIAIKKEYNSRYWSSEKHPTGYSTDGHRTIIRVKPFDTFFIVEAEDRFRDQDPTLETIKIPYDENDDEKFIAEFKEELVKEYKDKMQKSLDEKRKTLEALKKELGE